MTSPFKTYQEFYEAEGAIYTFSDRPMIIAILLIVSALMFLYFIYATFQPKREHLEAKSPVVLSLLIITSAVSLVDTIYTQYIQRGDQRSTASVVRDAEQPTASASRRNGANPLEALPFLGLVGGGAAASRRRTSDRPKAKLRRKSGTARNHRIC